MSHLVPLCKGGQVSANLSPELYKRLNTYCENNNITKTSVINKAVDKYLDEI